ncbi:MAG: hypothetical protein KDB37_23080, partial [Ilumatobacter sp.]|nr:hypothetical protein [Ilumatobacter sp.]
SEPHREELVKEAATMALYVAICLLAALTVASHDTFEHRRSVVAVVWGTTLGLALAHWFAFRLSSRLVASGSVRRSDAELAVAQLVGSIAIAAVATIPVLLVDGEAQLDATRWVVAGCIAIVGFGVARSSGASIVRSVLYGSATLIVASVVVLLKNSLSGH